MKKGLVLLLLTAVCVWQYIVYDSPDQDPYRITDYSRLHPVRVEKVVAGREEEQLARVLQEARERGLTVSIAGQRHSQGGHTYYKDGIVLDMTSFNRILSFDPQRKQIRVQAGVTWKDIQNYIQPHGLAVASMQSQNLFTVGGSISVNAHGRDIRSGSLIGSVESFRLLTADGEIRQVSREENADWFPYVLGGYGLFGVIVDVTLRLTDDAVYRTGMSHMTVEEYPAYFRREVLEDPDIQLHMARISVAPDHLLTDMYALNYKRDASVSLQDVGKLSGREAWVIPAKLAFALNRASDWGKNKFWAWQETYFAAQQGKALSRNNAMRSESAFMVYSSPGKNDLLQEYFIPPDRFADFVQDLRAVLTEEELNLLNITVRYVPRDEEAVLSYAREDMLALVCLFHAPLSEEGQLGFRQGIARIIDLAVAHRGSYYLPYAAYPSREQFQAAYPRQAEFFALKDRLDPQGLFMNYFYEQYRGEEGGR
ncbi:FAD/FMN-containing dehydrogenase [Paenibacillus sp. UNCCL117]|uniref:FAD-binding oxidoreductase n=1 Tax=unclassified Paenibacillus TaxID=185978 RepID=UPI00087E6720|nr:MULTISPECIES: FAD-binding oxidoreductase [unclassified Paenibacillus]SDE41254.1 FAD/FMN-containing dehydrogenase [Paenibacillus sp. cl123]SFW65457.1 FAD/FMN-containing dehydrogenase [Paenibacillus sp. UNCCL117]